MLLSSPKEIELVHSPNLVISHWSLVVSKVQMTDDKWQTKNNKFLTFAPHDRTQLN
ncbi:hypothetical protein NSTC745_00629 [Nostoc sp. DSM 114161]|jgi:hypothetical protein|uniref:hypothetical protein n=1 Tax=Nostoc sp. DSM 114161 TaxID=3440143 RepID=UPI0040460A26